MNKEIEEVHNWITNNTDLEFKSYLKLDRQVWDCDNNLLTKFYKVKGSKQGIQISIDLNKESRGKVINIKICENHITTKKLLKLNNIKSK